MGYEAALARYTRFEFRAGSYTRPVYRRGAGPAVIVIHEVPGLHPLVIRFADRVAEAGMTVFCPNLFGQPGRPASVGYSLATSLEVLCVRREFDAWSRNRSSPIVDWLWALARQVHDQCQGRGVGAVGMCFTGNFVLAMMTEPSVVAPGLSQPSLPAAIGSKRRAALGLSEAEIACAKQRFEQQQLSMIGLRFHGDPLVPDARFDNYKRTFGEHFQAIEIPTSEARRQPPLHPHSVLTVDLRDDDPKGETKRAEQKVIAFLSRQLPLERRE